MATSQRPLVVCSALTAGSPLGHRPESGQHLCPVRLRWPSTLASIKLRGRGRKRGGAA